MAGLLDFIPGSPDERMAFFQGIANGDVAGSLFGAQDRKLKRGLLEAQIAETQAQGEQRKAATLKQAQLAEILPRLLSRSVPAATGQLGSGSFGVVPPPAGQSDIPRNAGGGIGNADYNDLVAYHALGGPDLLPAYKFAREGIERKPGTFYEDLQGRRHYTPDVKTGMDFNNGQINEIPGYSNFITRQTLAQEAPKTLLGSAAQLNMRKNDDGTESPVSALVENPTLQNVLNSILGASSPKATPTAGVPAAPSVSGRIPAITPDVQRARDAESIRILQSEVDAEKDPVKRAGLQREVDRMTAAQARPGFPAASMPKGIGYGKTTAQEIREAAEKAKSIKQAEADVQPTDSRQNAMASANVMLQTIDKALKHPGLNAATGLQGVLDPRNYIPGTDAKNFGAVRDQLKGDVFLQAYEGLKGGGQITEIEGKKAEDAKARLSTAQSTEAFREALQDLRDVTVSAISRMRDSNQRAGAPSSFPGDNAKTAPPQVSAGVKATELTRGKTYTLPNGKEAVWDGFQFKVK